MGALIVAESFKPSPHLAVYDLTYSAVDHAVLPGNIPLCRAIGTLLANLANLSLGQFRRAALLASGAIFRSLDTPASNLVPHVLGMIAKAEMSNVHASMTSRPAIAAMQYEEVSRIAVGHSPDRTTRAYVLPSESNGNNGVRALRGQKDAFIGRGSSCCREFGGAADVPLNDSPGAPRRVRASVRSRPSIACLAPWGAPNALSGTRFAARENDAAGCTLGHVAPLGQVRPRPRVVSATAGALLYGQCSSGTARAADRSGGVN